MKPRHDIISRERTWLHARLTAMVVCLALLAAIGVAWIAPGSLMAAEKTGSAGINVMDPLIFMDGGTELDFGKIIPPSTNAVFFIVGSGAGSPGEPPLGDIAMTGADPQARAVSGHQVGIYQLKGHANTPFNSSHSVSACWVAGSVGLEGSDVLFLDLLTLLVPDGAFDASGDATLYVGGSLNVKTTANGQAGSYECEYTVSADY